MGFFGVAFVGFFFTCCLLAEISFVCKKSYCYRLAGGATPFLPFSFVVSWTWLCMWEVPPSVVHLFLLNVLGNMLSFGISLSLSLTCDCLVVNKFSTLSNSISNTMHVVVKNVTGIT